MKLDSLILLNVALLLAAPLTAPPAQAQAEQARLKIVVPFPPGGAADFTARLLGQHLAIDGKRVVIVENQAGANGNTGAEFVARSTPDGTTLLISSPGVFTTNRLLYKSAFNPAASLVPVSLAIVSPNLLVVNAKLPVADVAELIAYARANPGKLAYASQGKGSTAHLSGAFMAQTAGLELAHVPYRGDAPALNDVVAGHVAMMWNSLGSVLPLVRSGQLRALAVGSKDRIPELPTTLTAQEAGLAGFESVTWFAVAAPAGTPQTTIASLSREIGAIMKLPEVTSRLGELGLRGVGSTPESMASFVASETIKWTGVIEKGRLAAD